MDIDELREYLTELRENWSDPYWRLDHPEVVALGLAVITGIIGLLFATLQAFIQRRLSPDAR